MYCSSLFVPLHPKIRKQENKRYIKGGVSNLNASFSGGDVYCTFDVGGGSNGFCTGESCDISATNIYGDTTNAAGRIWFPHWNAIYTGSAQPPFYFKVETADGEVVTGETDDTSFSVGVSPSSSAKVCVGTDPSSYNACITVSSED